jgi:hypothetical protein
MSKQTSLRGFKGIWIPKDIWLNRELSIQEKVLYAEINSLDKDEKGCYATNQYFAKFFGLSKVRISQLIASLADKKLIVARINKSMGNRRIINVTDKNIIIPSSNKINDPIKASDNDDILINNILDKYFEQLWNMYPRREGKKPAKLKFYKLNPDEGLFNKILRALELQIKIHKWDGDNKKYCPHPTTWLNQERWNDEIEINSIKPMRLNIYES